MEAPVVAPLRLEQFPYRGTLNPDALAILKRSGIPVGP
jgi:hypothetical protein